MSTEKDARVDVGLPIVTVPVIDVVRLAPAGRTLAARPSAPPVACGERDALPRSE